jgi:outer membrane receptor protein involved in Fe transport
VGDLLYQGVAAKVFNSFLTNGLQFDSSYIINDWHTVRFGVLTDYTVEKLGTDSLVFPQDPANPGVQTSDVPFLISDQSRNDAWMTGFYAQDEWRITRSLTLNYGLRYDRFDSNFDDESQFSPRVNLVWKIDKDTTTHVGYARYFVPPPVQYVSPGIIQQFAATTNNTTGTLQDDPPKVERSNYFDVGASRQIIKPWKVDVDAYYKQATNLIDLGQFGNAVILSPYNYASAVVYGAEFSTAWKQGGFSAFANLAYDVAKAHDIVSNQYQFTPGDLAYIQNNNIHLDHDSEYTASAGVAYAWAHDRVYVDMLYGSGLRSGNDNTQTEPMYYPINVGYEHVFHFTGNSHMDMRLRCDIINLFDLSYQIRSGTGLGVFAPQYGQRRSFLAGLTFDF